MAIDTYTKTRLAEAGLAENAFNDAEC